MSLYGKLNKEQIIKQYDGITTPTAKTTVDNIHNIIKVDVLPKETSIGSLTDVRIRELLDGQILIYDQGTNRWKNKTIDFDNLGIKFEIVNELPIEGIKANTIQIL